MNRSNQNLADPSATRHRAWIAAARQQVAGLSPLATGSSGENSLLAGSIHGERLPFDAIAGYEILNEIHRGGQGIVYRARQISTGQTLAIKVLREGPFAGARDRARFDREVHVLTQLSHPNIVRIIDRGASRDRDYLVMDFIDGRPLDRYIHEVNPPLASRLELFAEICDAVHAAHLRGIIHRDLKPSNVLIVDDDSSSARSAVRNQRIAVPKILDFGLAKTASAESDAAETRVGQFIGSYPWASPEQAAGRHDELDLRSDVYTLGAMLYHVVTGQMPYPLARDVSALLETIQTVEPIRPSRRMPTIHDDLETIILKSLRKEPDRRYQSAGELAGDIRHYLHNEPIEAKRDSPGYVFRKAMSRHRAVVGMAGAFVVVLMGATVISLSYANQAARRRNQAIVAQQREEAARKKADRESAKAGSINDFLQNMLSSADPEANQGRNPSARDLLDQSARDLDRGAMAKQPDVEAELRMTLGRAYRSLAAFDAAQAQFDKALALNEKLYGPNSRPYGETIRWMGELEGNRDHLKASEKLLRRALEIFRSTQPVDDLLIARTTASLALMAERQGRLTESESLTRSAVETLRAKRGPDNLEVVQMEIALANRTHDPDEGVRLAQRAVNVLRAAFGEKDASLANAMRQLAGAYSSRGDTAEAINTYEQALVLLRDVYGDDNPETLGCVDDLSFLYISQNEREKALALEARFLPAADRTFGIDSRFHLNYLIDLGKTPRTKDDLAVRERAFRDAIAMARRAHLEESAQGVAAKLGLVDLLLDRSDCAEAAPLIDQARDVQRRKPEQFPPATRARLQYQRAMILLCEKDFANAESLLEDASRTLSATHMGGAATRARIARAFINLYDAWDAAQPGAGKSELASNWRHQLSAIVAAPNSPPHDRPSPGSPRLP